MNKKAIALCGVPTKIAWAMEECSEYYILPFSDEPERRGDVKLAYFMKDGATIDLAVVGYPGTAGLTACDYLRRQSKKMQILWLCDRAEFEPEAQRMGVGFYSIGPSETGRALLIVPTDQTDQIAKELHIQLADQTLQTIQTEQTVQIILNAINMKFYEGGSL